MTIFSDQKQMSQRLEHIFNGFSINRSEIDPQRHSSRIHLSRKVENILVSPSPRGWNNYAQTHRTASKKDFQLRMFPSNAD